MTLSHLHFRYERRGLEALRAFTPFKIIYKYGEGRERADEYVLTIFPPKNYYVLYHEKFDDVKDLSLSEVLSRLRGKNVYYKWRASTIRRRSTKINKYTVYEYVEWPAFRFRVEGPYVLVIHRTLYKALQGDEQEFFETSKKAVAQFYLAEYSYNSLTNAFFCPRGFVLLSHRNLCPIKDYCYYARKCGGYLQNIKEPYAGLYKVSPQIRVEPVIPSSGGGERLKVPLFLLSYLGLPLTRIYFVDTLSLLAFYEGIVFYPKKWPIPYKFVRFKWSPGIRILDTDALVLEFESSTLDKIAKGLASESWIVYKLALLSKSGICKKKDDVVSCTESPRSIAPWRFIENKVSEFMESYSLESFKQLFKLNQDAEVRSQYLRLMIVHTLAHNVVSSLWDVLGLDEKYLSYKVLYDEVDKKWKIYVYETVSGGLGYLKYLAVSKQQLYEVILNAIFELGKSSSQYCVDQLERYDVSKVVDDIIKYLNNMCMNDRSCAETVESIERLLLLLRDIHKNYGVTIHPYTLRRRLAYLIPGRLGERFSAVVERILASFAWFDGSVGCCFIEDGCSLGPFIEPLSVSFSVARHIAEQGNQPPKSVGQTKIYDVVLPWLEMAEKRLRIVTSNISIDKKIHNKIIKKICTSNGEIYILLGKNAIDDEVSRDTINKLRQEFGECIKVKLNRSLHSKAIIIDDEAVIEGSFNFTKSGLAMNIESISRIVTDPGEVERYVKSFNDFWNYSEEF